MTDQENGFFWNNNAEAWTALARAGYDIYRNHFNTPTFFQMLPTIKNLRGIDIGCGEGYNTRLLADEGALIDAIDISPYFIQKAGEEEILQPKGIIYQVASAVQLPFEDSYFDFATAFMCMMDLPDTEKALQESYRVIKPGRGAFFNFRLPILVLTRPIKKI